MTTASKFADVIDARPVIEARAFGTLGDVVFTQYAVKARSALAYKAVDVVLAGGTVSAGMAGTLVNLNVTALSLKTWAAITGETPDLVHTRASIQTRVR